MSCTNCQPTKSVPTCSGVLILGQIDPLLTDVNVVVKDIITGRKRFLKGTINAGVLSVNLSSLNRYLTPNLSYTIEAFEGDQFPDFTQPVSIEIDGNEYDCLRLNFDTVRDVDNVIVGANTITLELL